MRETVSVALASYNGEKYIEEQIRTILVNLSENDEIVISDDGSTDNTLNIVRGFNDSRIRIIEGPHKGVKKNFENAILNCHGKYIFLCDQDDVWIENKVETVLKVFEEQKCPVVVHDCMLISEDGGKLMDSFFEYKKSGPGAIRNFIRNTYMGCCMAFDSKITEKILPIPNDIEMHDQWIGIIGDCLGKNVFIDDILVKYRRHDENESDCFHHYGLGKMISKRIHLLTRLLENKF